jgi:hypothetical protein
MNRVSEKLHKMTKHMEFDAAIIGPGKVEIAE